MKKDLERKFKPEQLSEIILKAEALRGLEDKVKSQHIIDLANIHNGDTIGLETVYEIARELDIPIEYLERSLKTYPDREQQLADLVGHNASPSFSTVLTILGKYKQELNQSLMDFYPLEEFWAWNDNSPPFYLKFFKIDKELKRKRFFGRFRDPKISTSEKRLAFFQFGDSGRGHFNLTGEIDTPIFLHACSQTIRNLNERYQNRIDNYSLTINYEIE